MNTLEKVEKRLGIRFPAGYRSWHACEYFDPRNTSETYLWVHEAEWIPPAEIPGYDLWRDTVPGLVPFAFNGAGDHWCFSTQQATSPGEFEIWFCIHDAELGEIDTPSFPAWFYRRCLSYAAGGFDEDAASIRQAQKNLKLWSQRLAEIQPGAWAEHLAELSACEPFAYKNSNLRSTAPPMFGFLTMMEVHKIVSREFGKQYLRHEVKWGTFREEE